MSLFRALPMIRLQDETIVIWVTEEKARPRRLTWISELLESSAVGISDESSSAIFVYGDGAIAWFDTDRLHYIPQPGPAFRKGRPMSPSEIAIQLHQAVARTGAVSVAMAEVAA